MCMDMDMVHVHEHVHEHVHVLTCMDRDGYGLAVAPRWGEHIWWQLQDADSSGLRLPPPSLRHLRPGRLLQRLVHAPDVPRLMCHAVVRLIAREE
jgi:hypothetical protein